MKLTTLGAAVAIAGTLDILAAAATTVSRGGSAMKMLQGVASGPFGDGMMTLGAVGSAIGLGVHFALMTVIVVMFALLFERLPMIKLPVLGWGVAYGVIVYLVMYWVVLPFRWPQNNPQIGVVEILVPLTIHILFVGLPIALIVARTGQRGMPLQAAA